MNEPTTTGRGATWLAALTNGAPPQTGLPDSVRVVDAPLAHHSARYIAVVADAHNRFVRARTGEVGLVEGWVLAQVVQEVVDADAGRGLGDLPYPPNYPKMPGEPKRVAPSRDRDLKRGDKA